MTVRVVHDADPLPLDRKKDGTPKMTLANVMTILSSDPDWTGTIAYDAFAEAPVLVRKPPMRVQDAVDVELGTPWSPQDSTRAATWIDDTYHLPIRSSLVSEAMLAVAQRTQVHPITDYLDGRTWDQQSRIDTFFVNYCGVPDSVYARGVARMLFVSAVARVRKPGCKVDTIPILEGKQGLGKSRMLKLLAGDWFADTPPELGSKDAYQVLRGVWLFELGELASFKGRDATRIKSFASSSTDHYRPSYAPAARSVPRQCIFIGSTNEDEYLVDPTGARRFWPVKLENIDLRGIVRDRDQIWAEADAMFKSGTPWWPNAALDALGVSETSERFESDPWEEPLLEWLARPRIDAAVGLTMEEILTGAIGMPKEKQDKRAQNRVAGILRKAAWRRTNPVRTPDGRVRKWCRRGAGVVPMGGDT